jgi:hypothetical protein
VIEPLAVNAVVLVVVGQILIRVKIWVKAKRFDHVLALFLTLTRNSIFSSKTLALLLCVTRDKSQAPSEGTLSEGCLLTFVGLSWMLITK